MLNRFVISCYLLLSTLFIYAQSSPVYEIKNAGTAHKFELNRGWKFHNGDDTAWASPTFDDSNWDTSATEFVSKNDSCVFTGIAWLRLHVYLDSSSAVEPLYFYISQNGASELFVDGRKLYSWGKPSGNKKEEVWSNPTNIPYAFLHSGQGKHVLAIRYSNVDYKEYNEKYNKFVGFTIKLVSQVQVEDEIEEIVVLSLVCLSIGFFFITLGFVHFLLFLFYRKQKSNLFYSFFVGSLGLMFIIPFVILASSDNILTQKINIFWVYTLIFFFYFMLVMNYSIFKRPLKMWFWISTALFIITLIAFWLRDEIWLSDYVWMFSLITLMNTVVISSFFIVIRSIRAKYPGAWILGVGALGFLLFLTVILALIMFAGGNMMFHIDASQPQGVVLLILTFLSIMSIPLSMSIYLAWDFARTSKKLEKHIVEVEQLSAKMIEQEKEKQKILETQNEILETQVQERTIEITNQKTIIERKNKDITDSIDYAKTIQRAILPAMSVVKNSFPDSFIVFKPKDIVSGDFYWVTQKNDKKIIAACDCTGHGVPGALMSMIGNNLLDHIVNENGITAPDEILNQLHKEIRKTLKQEEQNDIRDGMDIVILAFESETKLEYAAAQRPLWIVNSSEFGVRSSEFEKISSNNQQPIANNYQLTEIKGNKFSIGGLQSEKERLFTKHTLELQKGSAIYIFSDGYADQFSDTDKKLMSSRFKELLLKIQSLPMNEQGTYLNQFIDEFRGKREQIDDILVIGIKV